MAPRRAPRRAAPRAVIGLVALALAAVPATASGAAPQWQARGTFPLSLHHLVALACPTPTQCVAVGTPAGAGGGEAEFSADGGATWQPGALPNGTPVLHSVACPTASACVAIGGSPVGATSRIAVVTSGDGGGHWSTATIVSLPGDAPLQLVSCATSVRCLAIVGGAGQVHTELSSPDGGAHWSTTDPFSSLHLGAVVGLSCTSSTACVATGATNSGAGWLGSTADGGTTWSTVQLPAGDVPTGPIACASPAACVAAARSSTGRSGVLRTSTGTSWSFTPIIAAAPAIGAVACASTTSCYLGGATRGGAGSAWLSSSTDGGATWLPVGVPSTGVAVEGLSCATASTCVTIGLTATGSEQLLSVVGQRASTYPTSIDQSTFARDVACPTALRCVAVGGVASDDGEAAGVLVSADAGQHWAVSKVLAGASELFDVSCPSELVCMAAGVGFASVRGQPFGVVVRTTDAGAHWRVVAHEVVLRFLDGVSCTTATTCLVFGEGPRVLRTGDGGAHWSVVRAPGTVEVIDQVHCTTHARCLGIGSDATTRARLLVSTDAGRSWTLAAVLTNPLGSFYDQMSIDCATARICVAGGAGPKAGWLRWSVDGGVHWRLGRQPPGQRAVEGLSCLNPTFCLGAGFGASTSFVLRSPNGGRNWGFFAAPAGTRSLFGVSCGASGCWTTGIRANGAAELAALR